MKKGLSNVLSLAAWFVEVEMEVFHMAPWKTEIRVQTKASNHVHRPHPESTENEDHPLIPSRGNGPVSPGVSKAPVSGSERKRQVSHDSNQWLLMEMAAVVEAVTH